MWIVTPTDQKTRKLWLEVLGAERIRVLAPWTYQARMVYRGVPAIVPSYIMDTRAFSKQQLEQVIAYLISVYQLSDAQIRAEIYTSLIPIPAPDVQFVGTAPYVMIGSLQGGKGPFFVKHAVPGRPDVIFFLSRDWGTIDPNSNK